MAAKLAAKLGKPSRLLIGLMSSVSTSTIESQNLTVDIKYFYLGTGDWTGWNQPPCDYVCIAGQQSDEVGAVPMFVQYQMANNGDGNIAVITDSGFMTTYWARLKTLYQDIATYGKPALVNLEPDFWGYAEQKATNADPTKMSALVTINADCADLSNDVVGIAGCMIKMARKYAPKAYVGFPYSTWGAGSTTDVIAWMNRLGAQNADYIVAQTLDRDAGCFEAQDTSSSCANGQKSTVWYWDETNQTHPSFADHIALVNQYHQGIGGLPVIWWQTPMGVPSDTPGGTQYHYRDNRVHYFLTHPSELTAVGGLGVAFGSESHQTGVTTDGGQFQRLESAYLASPAPLP